MVLDSMVRRVRTSGKNPALQETTGLWGWATRSLTGTTVTDVNALSLTAFYRGVSLIAGTCGGLPLQVFEEEIDRDGAEGSTRKIKTEDTAYLWRRPNVEMTMQSFWEREFADEVRGNAFIFVEKSDAGGPAAIWHLDRQRVRVGRTRAGLKVYEVDGELPMIDYKAGGEIVHVPNWGGGLVGYDPVKLANEALALGLSAQEYVARFLGSGFNPPGLLTSDMTINPDEAERISERWAKQGGVRGAGRIPVLGSGAKFQAIAVDLERQQMEQLRRFQVAEVARMLGLPPHLLADVERSTSWGSGIEEQNRNLMTFTLDAHIRRFEQAISDDLLVRELTGRFARMNRAGLLRGNTLQRYQALRLADFMTVNEKRAFEELEPIEGGDDVLAMTNQVPLDQLGEAAMGAGQGGSGGNAS